MTDAQRLIQVLLEILYEFRILNTTLGGRKQIKRGTK